MTEYQPGRPFDALLALTVFDYPVLWLDTWGVGFSPYAWDKSAWRNESGGTWACLPGACWQKFNSQDVFVLSIPLWSTNRGDVWEIIDRICKENVTFSLSWERGEWLCEIERFYVDEDEALIVESADTPALAVCLAAMRLFS